MKKRITIAIVALLFLVSLFEIDQYDDNGGASVIKMDYLIRKIQTREKSENMWSAMEDYSVDWYGEVDESFPQELITELAEAFRKDEVQEFVSRYEADYKILTRKEICAYVDLDPVMHKFYETKETGTKECVWYQLRVAADNTAADDLVVCDEKCSYIFTRAGSEMGKGLPISGNQLFFVNWEGNNFIVSIRSDHEAEGIFVYYCDGYTYGREAVIEKTEDGDVEIGYYMYLVRPSF